MLTIEDFLKATKYHVKDSGLYLWNCYPEECMIMECYKDTRSWYASIVFGIESLTVYQADMRPDPDTDIMYRITHPDFVEAYKNEEQERREKGFLFEDETEYVDLEVPEDFIQKLTAVVEGKPFDDRVVISLDISDEDFLFLAKQAHERDITFNEYVAELITNYVEEMDSPV